MMDMDWIPVVFIVFKVIVFGTCMYFAIKWHYDQGKKKKAEEQKKAQAQQQQQALQDNQTH